ncbi:hypothetical protein ACOSQ2_010411 [Xanthoceras sorbifolium]
MLLCRGGHCKPNSRIRTDPTRNGCPITVFLASHRTLLLFSLPVAAPCRRSFIVFLATSNKDEPMYCLDGDLRATGTRSLRLVWYADS